MVYRIFVEKKEGLDNEARGLLAEGKNLLSIDTLENVRLFNRYDAEKITEELFNYSVKTVFSEPQLDNASKEIDRADFQAMAKRCAAQSIVLLENDRVRLELGGEHVTLLGLSDPSFGGDHARVLGELAAGEGYRILLSHRPERMKLYAEAGVDLVFSGHAHGGQFRIPFLGGVIAPDQGLFPEYDSGLYEQDGTAMLVSRGIGNSIIPLRICNRPEILVAQLKVSVGISE